MHVNYSFIAFDFIETGSFDLQLAVKLIPIFNACYYFFLQRSSCFVFLFCPHLVTFYRAPHLLVIDSSHLSPAFTTAASWLVKLHV